MAQPLHLRAALFVLGLIALLGQTLSCTSTTTRSSYAYGMQVLSTDLINSRNLTADDLAQIQFYIGREVTFTGNTFIRKKSIDNNTLSLASTTTVETITVPKQTPGIAVKFWEDGVFRPIDGLLKIAVCFVSDPDEYLIFSPDQSGLYRLELQHWNGILHYGAQQYQCISGCANNFLYFERKALANLTTKRRILPGRTFNNPQN